MLFVKRCVGGGEGAGGKVVVMRRRFCVLRQVEKQSTQGKAFQNLTTAKIHKEASEKVWILGGTIPRITKEVLTLSVFFY